MEWIVHHVQVQKPQYVSFMLKYDHFPLRGAPCPTLPYTVASRRTRGPIDNISREALSGLSQNNHSVVFRIDPITCVPNSVNDMACCITSFKPLIDLG